MNNKKSLDLLGSWATAALLFSAVAMQIGCASGNNCPPYGYNGAYNAYPYGYPTNGQAVMPSPNVGTPMMPGAVGAPGTMPVGPGYYGYPANAGTFAAPPAAGPAPLIGR